MSMLDSLKNPWVIVGGVGLGAILIMSARNSTPANNSGSIDPAYTSAMQVYNANAMKLQGQQLDAWASVTRATLAADTDVRKVQISATKDMGIATTGANVQRDLATLSFLQNMTNNAAQVAKQSIVSNQGIMQSTIQASAAVTQDQIMNMARMSLANIQAPVDALKARYSFESDKYNADSRVSVANITTNGQVEVARLQAKAVAKASKNNLIASIVSGVSKVAVAAL